MKHHLPLFFLLIPSLLLSCDSGVEETAEVIAKVEPQGERGGGIVIAVENGVTRGGIPSQLEDWTVWWRNRGSGLLDLGRTLRGPSSGGLVDASTRAISVAEQVLESVALDPEEQELAGPAMLAFARSSTRPDAVVSAARPHLSSRDQETVSAAVFALGVGGGHEAIPDLVHILNDDKAGRTLAGRKRKVDDRIRVDAAWALGLAARRFSDVAVRDGLAEALWAAVVSGNFKSDAIPAASVAALAMTKPSNPEHWATLLLDFVGDSKTEDAVRAQAPGAIARLLVEAGRPSAAVHSVVSTFLTELEDRRMPTAVRLGMVEAVGHLAEPDSRHGPQTVETLDYLAQRAKNRMERHFALLALGEFSSRGDGAEANQAFQRLMDTAESGKSSTKPWAALGLGILGRHFSWGGGAIDVTAVEVLRQGMLKNSDAEVQAAFAIALGLCGAAAKETAPDILKALGKSRNPTLQGAAALAIGMIGSKSSNAVLGELIGKTLREPEALGDVSVGLALAGGNAAGELFAHLEPAKGQRKPNQAVQKSILGSLARLGDPSVSSKLLDRAGDSDAPWTLRAAALDAAGASLDSWGEDWSASWSLWFNYVGGGWPETLMDYEIRIRGGSTGLDPRSKNR
ncbi:MAG TPA: hypothetical protein DDW23_02720 [Planctomycetes bacterium]|nr:hypothetical protein [Planctomycetota bacterium]